MSFSSLGESQCDSMNEVLHGSPDDALPGDFRTVRRHSVASRPGPSRVSQPAATTQRERNRQAQRAHRDRKEQYLKDLEREVVRLRKLLLHYATERDDAIRQRDDLAFEIHMLKSRSSESAIGSDAAHHPRSFSQDTDYSSSDLSVLRKESLDEGAVRTSDLPQALAGTLDYDQIALDFVLGLERPCLPHMRYLVHRANNTLGESLIRPEDVPDDGLNEHISGHALMLSCPSPGLAVETSQDIRLRESSSDLTRSSLSSLLGLCDELPLSGQDELPPVKAWARVRQDGRFPRLSAEDFRDLQRFLYPTIKCLRFGAVLSKSALEHALSSLCGDNEPGLDFIQMAGGRRDSFPTE